MISQIAVGTVKFIIIGKMKNSVTGSYSRSLKAPMVEHDLATPLQSQGLPAHHSVT